MIAHTGDGGNRRLGRRDRISPGGNGLNRRRRAWGISRGMHTIERFLQFADDRLTAIASNS